MPITYIPRGETTAETWGKTLEEIMRYLTQVQQMKLNTLMQAIPLMQKVTEPVAKEIEETGPIEAGKKYGREAVMRAARLRGWDITQPVPKTFTVTPEESEAGGLPMSSVQPTELYRRPGGIVSPQTGELIPTWTPQMPSEGVMSRILRSITGTPAPAPPVEVMPRAETTEERAQKAMRKFEEMRANILAQLPADKIEQVVYGQLGLTMSPAKKEELEIRETFQERRDVVKRVLEDERKFRTAYGQAMSILRGGYIKDPQTGVLRPLTDLEIKEKLEQIYYKDDPVDVAIGKLEGFIKKPALPDVHFPTPTELEIKELSGLVPGILGKDISKLTPAEQDIYLRGQKAGLVKVDESGRVVYEKQAQLPQRKFQVIPSLTKPGGHDIFLEGERGKMPQYVGTALPAPSAREAETLHQAKQDIISTVNRQITELDKRHGIMPGVAPTPKYFEDYYNIILEANKLFLDKFGENLPLYKLEKSKIKDFARPQLRGYVEEQIKKGVKSPADIIKKLTSIPVHHPSYSIINLFTPAEIASEINSILTEKATTTTAVPGKIPTISEIGEGLKSIYKKYLMPKPRRRKGESETYYPY